MTVLVSNASEGQKQTPEFDCAHKFHHVTSFLWKKIFDL